MEKKRPWESKTLWVNVLSLAGILAQGYTGAAILLEPQTQATLLAAANILLRLVTKNAVNWS